jgi:transcriptional regulator with XRE-family HTH domain
MIGGVDARTTILKQFGGNARKLRKLRQLSQEQLAELAGMDSTYISGIERGVRNPSLVAIVQLAAGLSVEPAELFGGLGS